MNWPASLRQFDQFSGADTFQKDGDETRVLLDFAMRLAFYSALTAIYFMIVALIVKLMWNNCNGDDVAGAEITTTRASESSRLILPEKEFVGPTYGTNEEDLESGTNCSSSEDLLYDGKICVICYDDQINCFFIPCGHCVTCHTCARRIMNEESKSCPICRGIIVKVRKLHIL